MCSLIFAFIRCSKLWCFLTRFIESARIGQNLQSIISLNKYPWHFFGGVIFPKCAPLCRDKLSATISLNRLLDRPSLIVRSRSGDLLALAASDTRRRQAEMHWHIFPAIGGRRWWPNQIFGHWSCCAASSDLGRDCGFTRSNSKRLITAWLLSAIISWELSSRNSNRTARPILSAPAERSVAPAKTSNYQSAWPKSATDWRNIAAAAPGRWGWIGRACRQIPSSSRAWGFVPNPRSDLERRRICAENRSSPSRWLAQLLFRSHGCRRKATENCGWTQQAVILIQSEAVPI